MKWRRGRINTDISHCNSQADIIELALETRTSDLNHDKKAFKYTLSALCLDLKKASSFPELVGTFSELFSLRVIFNLPTKDRKFSTENNQAS